VTTAKPEAADTNEDAGPQFSDEETLGGAEEDKGSVISQNHRAGGIQRGQHGGDIEPSGATGVAPRFSV